MIGIGTTLYRFNENRRVYQRDASNRAYGGPIYSEHFEPVNVIGETKLSWLCGDDRWPDKVSKKAILTGRAGNFFTATGMDDQIWIKDHRHRIRNLLDAANADQLRKIAEILGYAP